MRTGEGERLHKARRRRFWAILGALALLGMVSGLLVSAIVDPDTTTAGTMSPELQMAASAGVVLFATLFIYGSWRFFVGVDELEVADNLWGSLFGFYTYAILFPAWWLLSRMQVVGEPDDWTIFAASLAVGLAAYVYRKFTLR